MHVHIVGTKIVYLIKDWYRDRPALGKVILFQAGARQFSTLQIIQTDAGAAPDYNRIRVYFLRGKAAGV
jgi:hypothetical protein